MAGVSPPAFPVALILYAYVHLPGAQGSGAVGLEKVKLHQTQLKTLTQAPQHESLSGTVIGEMVLTEGGDETTRGALTWAVGPQKAGTLVQG